MKAKNEETKKPRRANGDGSVKERKDGRFEFRVVVGMDLNGKYIRKSFYGKTATDAKSGYKTYLKDNPVPLEKVRTLKDWAENWLKVYKLGKVEDITYHKYEIIVKSRIIEQLGHLKLAEIRPVHIEKLMRSVGHMSYSMQSKTCILIKGILRDAVENHYCKENVAIRIKPPKEVKKEIEIFKRSEIQKIISSDHPFAPIIKLMLMTGMRRGELLALSWRNVDYEENVIHVKQAYSDGIIKDTTKGKKDRVIPIGPELREVLDGLPRGDCFSVLSDGDTPMTPDKLKYRYTAFLKAVGVEYKSPHKCRHSFITYLIKSGVPIPVVQALVDHKDMSTTEAYMHVNIDDLKDNIVKLKF